MTTPEQTPQEPETTALIHVQPGTDPKIVQLFDEGVSLLTHAIARTITSAEDIPAATDDLSLIAKLKKAIEAERKKYVDPINAHLKAVNEEFKAFVEPLVSADLTNKQKVLAFRAEQERQRQEQERINQLREEAARAEMELKGEIMEPVGLVEVVQQAPNTYKTDTGALGGAKIWKVEVTDFSLLPNDYKLPDMVKIRAAAVAKITVPGVRAWQEESLRVTTR